MVTHDMSEYSNDIHCAKAPSINCKKYETLHYPKHDTKIPIKTL
jgi:hypothetical protein